MAVGILGNRRRHLHPKPAARALSGYGAKTKRGAKHFRPLDAARRTLALRAIARKTERSLSSRDYPLPGYLGNPVEAMFGWVFFALRQIAVRQDGKASCRFRHGSSTWRRSRWPLHPLEEKLGLLEKIATGPAGAYGAACAMLMLAVELLAFNGPAVPFVYFQF